MYGLQKDSKLTEAFVKTADKNIVDWYEVRKSEVYLDKLQRQIDDLQNQIDTAPAVIEYPPGVSDEVKQAIDYWNAMIPDLAELEEHKAILEGLQDKALQAEPVQVGP